MTLLASTGQLLAMAHFTDNLFASSRRKSTWGSKHEHVVDGPGPVEQLVAAQGDASASRAMILARLALAADYANTAVKMDQSEDTTMAARFYKKACAVMIATLESLNQNEKQLDPTFINVLEDKVNMYAKQLELLGGSQRPSSTKKRRQSHVAFTELDSLNTRVGLDDVAFPSDGHGIMAGHFEPEPRMRSRRPFWLLRLLRQSILFGGFLNEKVYVPKDVWRQHQAKLTALSSKTTCLEEVLAMICHNVVSLEIPATDADTPQWNRANMVFRQLLECIYEQQSMLSRSFQWMVPSEATTSFRNNLLGVDEHKSRWGMIGEGALNILTSKVVNPTMTAIKRVEAAVPSRITSEALTHYSELISEVCLQSQVIDRWVLRCGQERDPDQGHSGRNYSLVPKREVERLVEELAAVYETVICELLLRETQCLVERYMRKTRKSVVRMYWDEADEDQQDEEVGLQDA